LGGTTDITNINIHDMYSTPVGTGVMYNAGSIASRQVGLGLVQVELHYTTAFTTTISPPP